MNITKGDAKTLLIVMTAVFATGLLMNTFRDNAFVARAIDGFDS